MFNKIDKVVPCWIIYDDYGSELNKRFEIWTHISAGREYLDSKWHVLYVNDDPYILADCFLNNNKARKELIREWSRFVLGLKWANVYKKTNKDTFIKVNE